MNCVKEGINLNDIRVSAIPNNCPLVALVGVSPRQRPRGGCFGESFSLCKHSLSSFTACLDRDGDVLSVLQAWDYFCAGSRKHETRASPQPTTTAPAGLLGLRPSPRRRFVWRNELVLAGPGPGLSRHIYHATHHPLSTLHHTHRAAAKFSHKQSRNHRRAADKLRRSICWPGLLARSRHLTHA